MPSQENLDYYLETRDIVSEDTIFDKAGTIDKNLCRIMWRETGAQWGENAPYIEMEYDDINLWISGLSVFIPRSFILLSILWLRWVCSDHRAQSTTSAGYMNPDYVKEIILEQLVEEGDSASYAASSLSLVE